MIALTLALLCAAPEADARPVVSVLYFDNDSSDAELEFMRKGFADLLITDLVSWDGVALVERNRLEDVLKELNFQQTKYVDPGSAAKLGKVLSATWLIYGSMLLVGKTLKVTARIVRASDGEIIGTVDEQDERDRVFDLEQRLADKLVATLDVKLNPNVEARARAQVPNLDTLKAYGQALDLADRGKLEEAQKAMSALVSKSPTFLLGRERREQLLSQLEAFQQRKQGLINDALKAAQALVDEGLKDERKFDSLSKAKVARFLNLRMYRGRLLARVLRSLLGDHGARPMLPRPGEEAKALLLMRDWLANQRAFISENERAGKRFGVKSNGVLMPESFSSDRLDEKEAGVFVAAQLGESGVHDAEFDTLVRFVWLGRVSDAKNFDVAPLLGAVDEKEGKAVLDELERRIVAALARREQDPQAATAAHQLMELSAELATAASDAEGAVTAWQRLLDAFPTDPRMARVEERVKSMLKGNDNAFRETAKWVEYLKTCKQMPDLEKPIDRRLQLAGLQGLDVFAAEFEQACPPTQKKKYDAVRTFERLASVAADADDCERFRRFSRRALELGGQVSSALSRQKSKPWCELGDVRANLAWVRLTLDLSGRPFAFERLPQSRAFKNGIALVSANTDGPRVPNIGRQERFDLRVDPKSGCQATWVGLEEKPMVGTCEVTFTSQPAEGAIGFDEGTFTAVFPKTSLTGAPYEERVHGDFRTYRQPAN
jgi:TolB-like protein